MQKICYQPHQKDCRQKNQGRVILHTNETTQYQESPKQHLYKKEEKEKRESVPRRKEYAVS